MSGADAWRAPSCAAADDPLPAGPMTWFIVMWAVLATVSFQYIVARGLFYVNWPRLNKPDEAIYYGESCTAPPSLGEVC